MINNYRGLKRTAHQLAKELIIEYGEGAHYWYERQDLVYRNMTQREVDAVDDAVAHHWDRPKKFFNADPHTDSGKPE